MLREMTAGFEDKDNREREDCENTEGNQDSHVPSSTKKQANVTNDSVKGPTVGSDLWKQLKRVSTPVFYDDKRTYGSWKAASQHVLIKLQQLQNINLYK